jgi:hypothetical protein
MMIQSFMASSLIERQIVTAENLMSEQGMTGV